MMSQEQMYSIIDDNDDDDDDSSDIKEVMPCPPYMSPVGYSGTSTPRHLQSEGMEEPIKIERDLYMNFDTGQSGVGTSYGAASASDAGHSSVKQREASEYTYAQALLKQAPKLTSSGDLDGSSVLRLARAYITLQQGLKSWENSGNKTKWWPDYLDGGKLTLAAQETMNCFVLIMTSTGHIVYISDAVESLLGHVQINLVGRRIQNVVPPDELPVLEAQFALNIAPSGRPTIQRSFYTRMLNLKSVSQQQRYELVHMIGHLQEVSLSSGQSGGGVQRETWLMCACKVMAPHIEEEGHHAPVKEWISHNALDGKILYMDPKSCQVTGYLPQEMVGRSTYCFIHQDDLEHAVFSHNQALINVGGSSCTYRMYRRSNDVVYVHTTTQLARDKLSNKPTFLFCINRIMDETEGKLQISRHQQNLMSVKEDPSTKYSMNDIEKTVKALEVEGGNFPPVTSRGGMKPSKLTDSCSADGGDLLRVDLPSLLRFPPLFVKAEKDQWAVASSCYSQSSMKLQYNSGGQYQQGAAQVSGYPGGFDSSSAEQQNLYSRSSQQNAYSNQYQQMPNSASLCHGMISTTSPGDSPVSGTGSYVDYLYNNAASPSVPPDGSTFNSDALLSPSMVASSGQSRGRGRTRGRPRGSGRGTRGATRGVRGTRGPRSRGGRGRGRGSNASQLSQMGDVVGGMKKSDSLISCGAMSPLGNISPMGSTSDLFSSHSNMGLQRSNSSLSHHSMSGVEFQRIDSDGDISSSGLQRMNTDDSMIFQRMPPTLDDIDYALSRASSDDMISSRSWAQECTPSAQVPPYRATSSSEHVVHEKKVGRPRGSRNHAGPRNLQRNKSVEDTSLLSLPGYNTGGHQSSVYNQDVNLAGQNTQTSYNVQSHSPRGGGGSSFYHHSQSAGNKGGHDNFQRTMSLQNHSLGHLGADMQDPEHSILGNLLKGKGDATASVGNKSPAHSVLMNVGRSADHFLGLDRGVKSPASQSTVLDRGGRSPAHSFISDVASPVSVFSPDPSRATPSIIKDEPDLLSPYGESSSVSSTTLMINPNLIQNLQQTEEYLPLDQGQQKTLSEMQMFSSQLRQKHHLLAQSLANQDVVLHQMESKMQQVAKDLSPESVYSQLNARLNVMKSDKAKQEKELQLIQARLEEQLRQQQPRQHQQQQQQIDLQRHRLGSPAPTNTRRMAIVPPIQRQPTEGDLSTNFSQHDMKSAVSQQDSLLDDGVKPVLALSPQNADISSKTGSFPNLLHSGKMSAGGSSAVTSTQNLLHQPTQQSPFSLHHHHHHHHHYHHHPLLQPPSRLQPHADFAGSLKGGPSQPPPPYSSFDSSVFNSAVAPTALSISVSTSNTSPIICDTSPVSVDESPGCGSDASSGYHSLSLGADSVGGPNAGQYNKVHCLDMPTSALPSYNSKSNPSFGQSHHNTGKSPDFIPSSGQNHNKSPST